MNATVISLGFGSRTGAPGVVTLGFGTSGVIPLVVIDTHDGGKQKRRDKEFRERKEKLRADVAEAWSAILDSPIEAEAKEIAKPVMRARAAPQFEKLPVEKLQKLLDLYKEAENELHDEEAFLLLM